MNNYLKAIQNLKTESWIKYWLMNKSKVLYPLSEILTGTEFYLQDSAPKKFKRFDLIGRSTQESTTGKNKFSSELELGSIDNSTGLPSSSAVNTCLRTKDYIAVEPNTTYTIKNNKGYYTFLYFYQEDKTYISYSRNTTDIVTFTTDSNTYFIKLRTSSDRNENDITAKYMLNTGSTAEPYEPYTGGQPAPNPNYEMPIKNTGDNGSVNEKIVNKNICSFSAVTRTDGGVTLSKSQDGTLTFSGIATKGLSFFAEYKTIPAGTYTVSLNNNLANITGVSLIFIPTYQGISCTVKNRTATFTFENDLNGYYISISNGTNVNGLIMKPQIEKGSTATEYQPHSEQNITFPLAQGQRLMEGDYLADDGVHHVRGEVVFDGSDDEAWSIQYNDYFVSGYIQNIASNTINSLCNIATIKKLEDLNPSDINKYAIQTNSNGSRFWFRCPQFANITAWKTYLASNPMSIQYPLTEEEIDTYTEEQQAVYNQIKEIKTYKPVTHIFSEDETPANVKIQYYKEG